MSTTVKPFVKQEKDFDIQKLAYKFISYWKYYLLCLVLFFILGAVFIRYSNPLYKINAKLLIQDQQSSSNSSSFLQSSTLPDFNGLFDVQSNLYNEVSILQTRDLIDQVIDKMDLSKTYSNEGSIRDVEIYKRSPFHASFTPNSDTITEMQIHLDFVDGNKSDDFTLTLGDIRRKCKLNEIITLPQGKVVLTRTEAAFQDKPYLLDIKSPDAVLLAIKNNLIVALDDKETSIINMSYNTNLPHKGEDFLQTLIDTYLHRNLNEKNQMNDSTITFINDRIGIVSGELGGIEKDIEQFKQSNKIVDLDEQSKALVATGADYYQKLNEADVQLDIVKTMLSFVQTEKNGNRPVPALITSDPSFLVLLQQYNTLLAQKSRLLVSVKENNPLIQNLNTQLSGLRSDIERSLVNLQKSIEIGRQQLVQQNSKINNLVYNAPAQEREYIDYTREKDVKQALYLYLLEKKEETSISKASSLSNASVIEKPKSDYLPYFPNKILIFAVCGLLGLIIPTLFILLKDIFSNRITSRDDITNSTNVTILAEIGHNENTTLISVEKEGRTSIAEQFRVLRTNLDFVAGGKKCPIILNTSSTTGEGKSFISANLAQMYAYTGKKVLLMELDLRKPMLSTTFGIPNVSGFSNFAISQDKPISEFIHPIPNINNLFILQSGPVPPNPAELILSKFNPEIFETLRQSFDIIIMDTPPFGVVTDTQLLFNYSDINLFVLRQGVSYKIGLDALNELKDVRELPNLYLIVNDVKKGGRYQYGYGRYYGYGYGYQEKSKKKKLSWFSASK